MNGDGAGAASAIADPAPTAEPEHAADVAASEPEAIRQAQLSQVRTRVSASIDWYELHATWSRIGYCLIKLLQILAGAAVPVAAGAQGSATTSFAYVTGGLGGFIVVLEGVQQLFQFHENWYRYRQTSVSLRSEQALFEAGAGDYATAEHPVQLLATKVEALASRETTAWASTTQNSTPATG